ncbi:uncharacterized protein LOC135218709 [Macrobrachium nipponense]|uniref:uncharacterized protein LOC135218709 n=1 Tax=Macrobrachium nipponense TaxID=159736 RepID=UPI0030C7E427
MLPVLSKEHLHKCRAPVQDVQAQQDAVHQQEREEKEKLRKPHEEERKAKEEERQVREERWKHELALKDEEIKWEIIEALATREASRPTPIVPHNPTLSCQPIAGSPPASSISEEVSPPVNTRLAPEGESKEEPFTSPHLITAREDSSPVSEHTASLGDPRDSQPVVPSRLYHLVPRKKFWKSSAETVAGRVTLASYIPGSYDLLLGQELKSLSHSQKPRGPNPTTNYSKARSHPRPTSSRKYGH